MSHFLHSFSLCILYSSFFSLSFGTFFFFFFLTLLNFFFFTHLGGSSSENSEPEIISSIPNMTVAVGREARIPCAVKNLGTYRVSIRHCTKYFYSLSAHFGQLVSHEVFLFLCVDASLCPPMFPSSPAGGNALCPLSIILSWPLLVLDEAQTVRLTVHSRVYIFFSFYFHSHSFFSRFCYVLRHCVVTRGDGRKKCGHGKEWTLVRQGVKRHELLWQVASCNCY